MPCISFDSKGSNDKSKFELGERMSNEAVNINGEEYKKVKNLNLVQKGKKISTFFKKEREILLHF